MEFILLLWLDWEDWNEFDTFGNESFVAAVNAEVDDCSMDEDDEEDVFVSMIFLYSIINNSPVINLWSLLLPLKIRNNWFFVHLNDYILFVDFILRMYKYVYAYAK